MDHRVRELVLRWLHLAKTGLVLEEEWHILALIPGESHLRGRVAAVIIRAALYAGNVAEVCICGGSLLHALSRRYSQPTVVWQATRTLTR